MILRTLFTDGVQNNIDLGKSYQLVLKEVTPQEFSETFSRFYGSPDKAGWESCYGFLVYAGGRELEPLYKGFHYEIKSESGDVFDVLTSK